MLKTVPHTLPAHTHSLSHTHTHCAVPAPCYRVQALKLLCDLRADKDDVRDALDAAVYRTGKEAVAAPPPPAPTGKKGQHAVSGAVVWALPACLPAWCVLVLVLQICGCGTTCLRCCMWHSDARLYVPVRGVWAGPTLHAMGVACLCAGCATLRCDVVGPTHTCNPAASDLPFAGCCTAYGAGPQPASARAHRHRQRRQQLLVAGLLGGQGHW